MSLFKRKILNKRFASAINLIATLALLAHILSPAIAHAEADTSDNSTTPNPTTALEIKEDPVIFESPAGRLMEAGRLGNADLKVKATITAYTSTPDQTDDSPFIAASGKRVYDGMIAANWLPMGTKIKIPSLYGDKIFSVEDRMNKRFGYGRMDIWLDTSKSEARKFGVKHVEVEVYYEAKELAVK